MTESKPYSWAAFLIIGVIMELTYGSVCSGIEAASVAWVPLGWRPLWLAEFDKFPSIVLNHHYPGVPNVGDMTTIEGRIEDLGAPHVLVGGTPCQSFSLAGERSGIEDERGALSLSFVRIYHEIRRRRSDAIALWENVPGALSSRDNAFGCVLAGIVGASAPVDPCGRWPGAGVVSGPLGGAAWRILDAQYFGVAQRRRRLFVVASDSAERCAEVLFERAGSGWNDPQGKRSAFIAGNDDAGSISRRLTAGGQRTCYLTESFIDGSVDWTQSPRVQIGATGTLTCQNKIATIGHKGIRRLTPIEYERLQGFPDGYTSMLSDTQRYKALGNSMAVPVMRWIGERIQSSFSSK